MYITESFWLRTVPDVSCSHNIKTLFKTQINFTDIITPGQFKLDCIKEHLIVKFINL